ncbi:molybdopterin-binding protein [Streptomyces sp. CA-181903]|uniref:molybdopterin molybdotransferase MoeA n=1 Tax=Streptomyces sp. CA-181903 TaxID=3240055 RepID=UPI003D8BB872
MTGGAGGEGLPLGAASARARGPMRNGPGGGPGDADVDGHADAYADVDAADADADAGEGLTDVWRSVQGAAASDGRPPGTPADTTAPGGQDGRGRHHVDDGGELADIWRSVCDVTAGAEGGETRPDDGAEADPAAVEEAHTQAPKPPKSRKNRRRSDKPLTSSAGGEEAEDADGKENAAPRHPDPARTASEQPRRSMPWAMAGGVAAGAAEPLPALTSPLAEAVGRTLAAPLTALTDLPSFDTSAMDGWAVAGPGPWRLPDDADQGILAGHAGGEALRDGHAVPIATGARIPAGATAVLRTEHGRTSGGELHATRRTAQGQDIRPRGQECRRDDELLPAGTLITPAVLGLAAAAGHDGLPVTARPRVLIVVLGDELVHEGLPQDGRIRDALGPMLAPWLRSLGAEAVDTVRLGDDADALHDALAATDADVVITTGGTASGPRDHLHPTLRRLDAELLVDGVAVRPGHPMLLARLTPERHLVGLPGNPLAAVAGLLTLAEPLLRGLSGRAAPSLRRAVLTGPVPSHPSDTRLVPVVLRGGDGARPLRFHGPAMLRGLAAADAIAVIPPGGNTARGRVALLDLPWTATGGGVG